MNPRDIERRLKENKQKLGWTEQRKYRTLKTIGTNKSASRLDPAMLRSFNSQLELILENDPKYTEKVKLTKSKLKKK